MLDKLIFANPYFLLLLALVPLMALYHWRKKETYLPLVNMSDTSAWQKGANTWRAKIRPYLFILKLLALAALILALARPQNQYDEQKISAEGIDIVIAMDISGSMLARDFEPDRLGAAKRVAAEFVENRPHDRIGLVVFAGESFTQCPATTDHKVLESLLEEVKPGITEDGTAIGMGLATATTRLQDSKAKSKVIILLTDGVNNAGFFDPLTAAETAVQYGIKVYTIGVGTTGQAPYPVQGLFGMAYQYMEVKIDEELLQKIAEMTGGKYFRATDNNSLRRIYGDIDKLEKTEIDVTTISRYSEKFYPFVFFALICLVLETFSRRTLFKGINE